MHDLAVEDTFRKRESRGDAMKKGMLSHIKSAIFDVRNGEALGKQPLFSFDRLSGRNSQVMSPANWQAGNITSLQVQPAILNTPCNTPPR